MEESKHSDSVFLQWDCAQTAKQTQKLEKLKRKLLKLFKGYDLYRGYHVKADVLSFPKMW